MSIGTVSARRRRLIAASLLPAVLLAPALAGAAIREIQLQDSYVAAGDDLQGTVATIRVTVIRDVDVPSERTARAGRHAEEVLARPVKGGGGPVAVPFRIETGGMLTGALRVKAKLLTEKGTLPPSVAWSVPVTVGVRRRVSLAGDWQVLSVKPLGVQIRGRPRDWKLPPGKPNRHVQSIGKNTPSTVPEPLRHCTRGAIRACQEESCAREKKSGGEGGIRTPGTQKGHAGFRNRSVRPLRHLSATTASR